MNSGLLEGCNMRITIQDKPAVEGGQRLFERSILLPILSCLTEGDEASVIDAFQRVLRSIQ
jgi:hypothetical protein